jgi:hypothetical protein
MAIEFACGAACVDDYRMLGVDTVRGSQLTVPTTAAEFSEEKLWVS